MEKKAQIWQRQYANDDAKRSHKPRKRKLSEGRRLNIHICPKASWRITRLSKVWECSLSQAIERLILEADNRYEDALFPDIK